MTLLTSHRVLFRDTRRLQYTGAAGKVPFARSSVDRMPAKQKVGCSASVMMACYSMKHARTKRLAAVLVSTSLAAIFVVVGLKMYASSLNIQDPSFRYENKLNM